MNFLYPTYFFGLLVIVVPIIIHFFNFQRAKRVYFTNVSFLKTIKETTNARSKVKNILVLLSRILFLIFLVITFAQPFIAKDKSSAFGKSNFVSVYIDNSYSMQNENDDKSLFDIGIEQVRALTTVFKSNTSYQLLDNSFDGNANYFKNKDKFLDKLSELKFANKGRKLENIYNKQITAFNENASPNDNYIFWISDFQKSTLGDVEKLSIDSNNNIIIIPLEANLQSNLYVDSVWLNNPFIKSQETNTCFVKVANSGTDAVSDKVVRLYIDGKQVSGATVSVAKNSSETISLDFSIAESGDKKCKIVIEDYPIVFDDSYYFVLKVAPKIKIFTIRKNTKNNFIKNVFSNESFFENTIFNIASIDYNALENADLIILENISEIDNALLSSLRKKLKNGGSIAVFPSENSSESSYTALLGISITAKSPESRGFNSEMLGVQAPKKSMPFFDGVFEKIRKNMSMPKGIPTIDWRKNSGEKLLKFKNGMPFLSAIKNQTGKIYLFASPLESKFSNLGKHALFVPIMYKMALSSKVKTERLAFSFEESIATLQLENISKKEVLELKSENFGLIPGQRFNGNQLLLNIPKTAIDAGNYDLIKKQSGEYVASIAFNYAPKESVLGSYSVKELQKIFATKKNVQIFDSNSKNSFINDFKAQNISEPLWRYSLLLALLFLLTETLLIRFWKENN